ncbi:hypothetical protein Droror1_Dr00003683 [Drosera rotundifolia]
MCTTSEGFDVPDPPCGTFLCISRVDDLEDDDLLEQARFAVDAQNKEKGTKLEFHKIVKAMKQGVGGILYCLTIEVKDIDGIIKTYQAKTLYTFSGNVLKLFSLQLGWSQFSHRKGPKKQDNAKVTPKTTGRTRKRSKKSNVEDSSNPSGKWVDPRHQSTPSDAGRRRIHANDQNSGHWFTGENGKKMTVYVSKNGKQLSGKIAYTQYRKDYELYDVVYHEVGNPSKKGNYHLSDYAPRLSLFCLLSMLC